MGAAHLPEFDSRGSVAASTCVGTRGRPGVGAGSQPRVHRAPIPAHTPDPPTACVGVPGRLGRPEAGDGRESADGEAAHLQSEAGQRAGGSHRRRISLGRLPPAPRLRSGRGQAPGVESQRSQGLLEPQVFRGERRRERGGGGERREGRRRKRGRRA